MKLKIAAGSAFRMSPALELFRVIFVWFVPSLTTEWMLPNQTARR
jgi:hypothetical protein